MTDTVRLRRALWFGGRYRHRSVEEIRALTPGDIRALSGVGPVHSVALIAALLVVQSWTDDQIGDWLDPGAALLRERQQRLQAAMSDGSLSPGVLNILMDARRAHVVWQRATTKRTFREIGSDLGVGAGRSQQLYRDGLRQMRRAVGRGDVTRAAIAQVSECFYMDVFGERPRQEDMA